MEKVYCKDCKYYSCLYRDCLAPSNIHTKDTWLKPEKELIQNPGVKNMHNDCCSFEKIIIKPNSWLLGFGR